MAHYTKLTIFKDCYNLVKDLMVKVNSIDKRYRYTIGDDIRVTALSLVHFLNVINTSSNKKEMLDKFLIYYERLKLDIQLCVDLKIFSVKSIAQSLHLLSLIRNFINSEL